MKLFNDLKIDGQKVDDKVLLEDVQGNLLRGFSSLRTFYVFLRFPEDPAESRAWLRSQLLPGAALGVTSAGRQTGTPEAPAKGPFVNFFVSPSGLSRLGCSSNEIAEMDPAFFRGMRAEETRRILGDPPANEWAEEYRRPWDALMLVAFDPGQMENVAKAIDDAVAPLPGWKRELGNVLDASGTPVDQSQKGMKRFEPFGYCDNASSTVFSVEHAEALGIPEAPAWDPRRPLSVVLSKDPFSPSGFGSYVAFRKYKQDPQGFKRRVDEIADVLSRNRGTFLNELYGSKAEGAFGIFAAGQTPTKAEIVEFVKGRIMGRLPSGALPTGTLPGGQEIDNHAFNFNTDRGGAVCPFSAHIRKMNPRLQTGDGEQEKKVTIVRRGLPYGRSDGAASAGEDCGLLFLCAQADIGHQFEFIQQRWANDTQPKLDAEPTPMLDGVIGRGQQVLDGTGYEKNRYERFTTTIEADFAIWDLIEFQGGEYLFAPSLSGIKALATRGLS